MGNRRARGPLPDAVAERVSKGPHARQHRLDGRHGVDTVDRHGAPRAVAQRHVQGGAVLGGVDALSGEHAPAPTLDVGGARQVREQGHGLGRDAVLGIVEKQVAELQREA